MEDRLRAFLSSFGHCIEVASSNQQHQQFGGRSVIDLFMQVDVTEHAGREIVIISSELTRDQSRRGVIKWTKKTKLARLCCFCIQGFRVKISLDQT